MTDLEAAREISQALLNLPKDYPYVNEANEAFGRLILGELKLKGNWLLKLPDETCKFTVLLPKQEGGDKP